MPLIGRLPSGAWHAIGFGGHGVAPTTLAGELVAQAMLGERPLPSDIVHFGLSPTYGKLGLAAAQLTYWAYQARDLWLQWRHD
jgi:gamma-glutamylputrescine oxidase